VPQGPSIAISGLGVTLLGAPASLRAWRGDAGILPRVAAELGWAAPSESGDKARRSASFRL
jgi:hypothetical protein